MLVPLIGSFLLVLLAAVRVSPGLRRLPRWYALLIPLVLWLVVANLAMPLPKSYPDSPAAGLVFKAVQQLNLQSLSGIQYVFIVEGSSLTMNGFDGDRVQTVLNRSGIPSLVVQLSCAGANHAERFEYLKEFMDALRPEQVDALRKKKVVLCHEVELGYDKNPLLNFLRNGPTGRTMRYLCPENIPMIFSWLGAKYTFNQWFREHTLLSNVVGCGLFNLFHIGYLARIQELPAPYKENGFRPNDTQSPGFVASKSLYPPPDSAVDKKLAQEYAQNLRWQKKRDHDMRQVLRGLVTKQCYFAFPSWAQPDAYYNLWKTRQADALFFDGDGTALVNKLNSLSLWQDALHLQAPGAEIYSEEFAKYLVERIRSKDL